MPCCRPSRLWGIWTELSLHFIGWENAAKTPHLSSMHGEGEVQEDLRARSARPNHSPDKYLAARPER